MSSRRSFLSRFGIGTSALGAALGLGSASALAQSGSDNRFQPVRHSQDDWFDEIPGKHRCFFDTTTAEELADAYPQVIANRVDNARQVPAGIVALNRAQEHGYSTM